MKTSQQHTALIIRLWILFLSPTIILMALIGLALVKLFKPLLSSPRRS